MRRRLLAEIVRPTGTSPVEASSIHTVWQVLVLTRGPKSRAGENYGAPSSFRFPD